MTICIIPARGGSRRIPRKNIRFFHGKPIIAHSIETARESGVIDRIVVSTDDEEIATVARQYGAEVLMRNPELARDEVGTQEVMMNALQMLEATHKIACCLYATSPLLMPHDLQKGYEILVNSVGVEYVMSVGYPPLQDAGAFYFGWVSSFVMKAPLIGPFTRMWRLPAERVCDINTEDDWLRTEQLYADLMGKGYA